MIHVELIFALPGISRGHQDGLESTILEKHIHVTTEQHLQCDGDDISRVVFEDKRVLRAGSIPEPHCLVS